MQMAQCMSNRRTCGSMEASRTAPVSASVSPRCQAAARLGCCLSRTSSLTPSPRSLQQQHNPFGGPSSSSSPRGSSLCCGSATAAGLGPSVAAAAAAVILERNAPHASATSSSTGSRKAATTLVSTSESSAAAAARVAAEAIRLQQQQVQPTEYRFATLTRILLTGNNTTMFRQVVGQRRAPTAGPLGLLLFLLTVIAATLAAIRAALVRKVRGCRSCRGYGIQRCRLCMGAGRVDWSGKLSHADVCPLCMNKRFVVCESCGGHHSRSLFMHLRRRAGGVFQMPFPEAGAAAAGGVVAAGGVLATQNQLNSMSSLESVDLVEIAGVGAVSSNRND